MSIKSLYFKVTSLVWFICNSTVKLSCQYWHSCFAVSLWKKSFDVEIFSYFMTTKNARCFFGRIVWRKLKTSPTVPSQTHVNRSQNNTHIKWIHVQFVELSHEWEPARGFLFFFTQSSLPPLAQIWSFLESFFWGTVKVGSRPFPSPGSTTEARAIVGSVRRPPHHRPSGPCKKLHIPLTKRRNAQFGWN